MRTPTWVFTQVIKVGAQFLLPNIEIKNGRVGAINLEQLDVLLNSLKTYWEYGKQKSILDEIKAPVATAIEGKNVFDYEL